MYRLLTGALAFAGFSLALTPAYASDTESYGSKLLTIANAPTLMMMIDTSGSMNYCVNSTSSNTCSVVANRRINVMRDAVYALLDDNNGNSVPGYVRVGLSRYKSDGNAGYVVYPPRPLDALTDINPDGVSTTAVTSGVGDAHQTAAAMNSSATAVLINGNYTVPASPVLTNGGLYFTGINIPRGATVTDAYIEVTAKATSAVDDPLWAIQIQNVGSATDFTSTPIDSRSYTDTGYFRPGQWTAEQVYKIDVLNQVTGMVVRNDWCGGPGSGNMAFRIQDVSGTGNATRQAYSFEGASAKAARLVVGYTLTPGSTEYTNSCIKRDTAFTYSISSTADDAWYSSASSSNFSNADSTQYLGRVASAISRVNSLRFPSIALASTDEVLDARLYLEVASHTNDGKIMKWTGVNQNNFAAFSSRNAAGYSGITLGAATTFNPNSVYVTEGGKNYYKLDVTSSVKNVVNSTAGWASGNALGFLVENNTGVNTDNSNNTFYTRNQGADRAPKLIITVRRTVTDLSTFQRVREALLDIFDGMVSSVGGGTPLGTAYVEAARAMLGAAPYTNSTYEAVAVSGSPVRYRTPLTSATECDGNYIFALTDGDPDSTGESANVLASTKALFNNNNICNGYSYDGSSYANTWQCMQATATRLATKNNDLGVKIKSNMVILGPLGGNSELNMRRVAAAGDGDFYQAQDTDALISALRATFNNLLADSGTVSSPGVAVNQLNRLQHLNELYYAVFDPDTGRTAWWGNVKRYKLQFTDTSTSSTAAIVDANNAVAVDSLTGFFKNTAKSFWSADVDGNRAQDGGAASKMPAPDNRAGTGTKRTVYSYVDPSYSSNMTLTQVDPSATSTFATKAKTAMGITDNTIYNNVMNWLLGYQVDELNVSDTYTTTSAYRNQMGGVLHSRPILVNYGYTGSDPDAAAADPSLQDNMLFYGTMEGMLHAVRTSDGKETFAFMPKEKLAELRDLYANTTSDLPKFGLDLTWTVYRADGNGDFKITGNGDSADTDKIWIYGGMRMGGKNYYALNVTNRSNPKLKWVIEGGTTGSFQKMGQSWSQPTLAAVKINGVVKRVLIFGGGYDTKHEILGYDSTYASDSVGNQIYIVDADTGSLITWASNTGATVNSTDLKFSIPSEIKTFDKDLDGLTDTLYFGDMGGQMFRIDLNNANTAASGLIKRVRRIAELGITYGSDNNTVNQRRFYEAPSVARLLDTGTNRPYVVVAIGSGNRSRTLDTGTDERFFVMRDDDVLRADLLTTADSTLGAVINRSLLSTLSLTGTGGVNATATGFRGWMIDLPRDGEKVISSPVIFNNEVIFSSYVPEDSVAGCVPVKGSSYLWAMSVQDGSVINSRANMTLDGGRTDELGAGLGGEPQIVVGGLAPDGSQQNAIVVGTNVIRNTNLNAPSVNRARWYIKK